jgi:CO/xanthine dehydrogenase Mo-binding subunit
MEKLARDLSVRKGGGPMPTKSQIGVSTLRKEAWDKVTGAAKYNGDRIPRSTLHARILTSTKAHAIIQSIDTKVAEKSQGVQKIITGE